MGETVGLVLSGGRRRWLLSTGTVGRHCFGASAHGATTLSARLLNLRASRRGAVAPLSLSRPFPSRSQAPGSLSWLSHGTGRIRRRAAWRGPSGLSSTLQINRYSIRPCHWQTAHTYQSMHKSVRGLDPESALVVSQSEVAGRLPEKVVRWDCSGPSTLRPRVTDSGPR